MEKGNVRKNNLTNLFRSIPTGDSIAAYHILNALESDNPDPDEAAEACEWLVGVCPKLRGEFRAEAVAEAWRLRSFVPADYWDDED